LNRCIPRFDLFELKTALLIWLGRKPLRFIELLPAKITVQRLTLLKAEPAAKSILDLDVHSFEQRSLFD
jgi:hypothetical protein